MLITYMIAERGLIAMYTGDWHLARADLQRALDVSRDLGAPRASAHILTLLGELEVRTGEWDAASHHLEEALTLATHAKYGLSILWAQYHLARLDLLRGDPNAARTRLRPILDELSTEDSAFPTVLACLARIELARSEWVTALDLARQAVAMARHGGYRLALAEAFLVHGMSLVCQEDTAAAEPLLAECSDMAQAMPYPYMMASVLYELGSIHAHRGERIRAREQLEQARSIFQRLGARWDVTRTEDILANVW